MRAQEDFAVGNGHRRNRPLADRVGADRFKFRAGFPDKRIAGLIDRKKFSLGQNQRGPVVGRGPGTLQSLVPDHPAGF